ncbi:MAG: DUF3108 domain-containing protein [Mucilaginibacter sp.]
MNRIKCFLIIILFAGTLANAFAQDIKIGKDPVFKVGEELSYKLKYGFFTGAEATIKVEDGGKKIIGHPSYHITANGKTAGTFDIFYKVRNQYETYIDQETLLPYFYTENRREGSYRHTDNVTFSQSENKVTADKGVFTFKGDIYDFVSAYYFARNIDISKLKIGETFSMKYFLEDGVQTLTITYMGKEQVETNFGKFNCLKFNPTIIPGRIFKKDSKLYLWITDDNNRIPVKAHVGLVVGSVTMELTNAKGLKYPLNPISK